MERRQQEPVSMYLHANTYIHITVGGLRALEAVWFLS